MIEYSFIRGPSLEETADRNPVYQACIPYRRCGWRRPFPVARLRPPPHALTVDSHPPLVARQCARVDHPPHLLGGYTVGRPARLLTASTLWWWRCGTRTLLVSFGGGALSGGGGAGRLNK